MQIVIGGASALKARLTTAVTLVPSRYDEQRRPELFFQELADRIHSVPGGLALRVTRLAQVLRIWRRLRCGSEGRSSMIRHEIKDFRGLSYSARFLRKRRTMRLALICGLVIALCLGAMIARADSLELKNGSRIKGRFVGATDTRSNSKSVRRCNPTRSLT